MINAGPDHLQGNQCQGESQRTAILFDIRGKFRALTFVCLIFGLFDQILRLF